MVKAKLYCGVLVLVLTALFTAACAGPAPLPMPSVEPGEVTQEDSQRIAEDFVKSSPTFTFDGIAETLELTNVDIGKCPSCWVFVFNFDSRHAGYGDRTGQTLAQVITPHQVSVSVEQGDIKDAVMDDKWDMLEQKMRE